MVCEDDVTSKTSAPIKEISADQLPAGDVTLRVDVADVVEASRDNLGNPQWPELAHSGNPTCVG